MSGAKILIVDDEAVIALDLTMRLTSLGYTITGQAFSGEEAIEMARESQPQVVLMDVGLAGKMTGVEAAKVISDQLDIPILYITGTSEKALKSSLEQANIAHRYSYIIKPFTEEQLDEEIQALLGG